MGAVKKTLEQQYTFNDRTLSARQWAGHAVVSYALLRKRLASGWDIERAVTEPHIKSNGFRAGTKFAYTKQCMGCTQTMGFPVWRTSIEFKNNKCIACKEGDTTRQKEWHNAIYKC